MENIDMEESEKEIFGQQIIGETTNRMRMEGIDREERFQTCRNNVDEDNDDTDDTGEMDEIEWESDDEVFEEDDVEKEEKL